MQPNDITFFQRFQNDILAGRKTITIRDASESHFKAGDMLRVGRFEDDGYFCTNRSDRNVNCDAGYAERKTCATGKYVA
ncbi:UPF0267 protein [Salmonella enterica subsp. enterica]|uniref:UPF0267 protein n=1 Tax=Salmonella enterica I TaxID=59201 RepID=A0A447PYW5_SALET|nr:UPF0267 protein [Salmonella enterica subsp. enterica]